MLEWLEARRLLATFTVTNLGDSGAGSLRDAIEQANAAPGADIITFDASVAGTITLGGAQLYVEDDVAITGPGANRLTIHGNIWSRVFRFAAGNSSLSGLTIFGGYSFGSSGGGILNDGTLTITDSIISGNEALTGGGITNLGTLTITDSIISGNDASTGGGIYNISGTITIANSFVSDNDASYGGAGGIYSNGILLITNSTISGNEAGDNSGGGIYNDGTLTITGSTISSNESSYDGGGIYNDGGTMTIIGSIIADNRRGGGVTHLGLGRATVASCIISGNWTFGHGGGIENHSGLMTNAGLMTVTDSAIVGNYALYGGGIYNDGTLTITSSTIADNESSRDGGGIYNVYNQSDATLAMMNTTISGNLSGFDFFGGGLYNGSGATATIANSTVVGNSSSGNQYGYAFGGGIYTGSDMLTALSTIVAGNAGGDVFGYIAYGSTHNLIQDAVFNGGLTNGVSGNLVGVDPLLGPLADNGGPTRTHALLAGSPAINAGTNPRGLIADQRGHPRVRGGGVDIGAFELNAVPTFASLTPSVSSLARGQSLTLAANSVADADGSIARVDFYRDANGNGTGDAGELLGSDTSSADGYTLTLGATTGLPLGPNSFLALAVDNDGERSTLRSASVMITNALPTLVSLTPSASPLTRGQSLTLTANSVADADGSIARVDFYRDANGNGVGDAGELLGSDASSADGYTFTLRSTTGLPLGPNSFLALAVDNDGQRSNARGASATLLSASQFASLPTQLLGASAGSTGNINITTQSPAGQPIVLQQAGGQTTWTGSDLQQKTGSPDITGEMITWVDPKDRLTYAAAMTTAGLGLFTNTTGSTWTFRNLTTSIYGAGTITGTITAFTSTTGLVSVAGVESDGDLLLYTQTGTGAAGNYAWTATNLGEELRSQNLVMPTFVGSITSFVTPWNALNIVGLDDQGDVQAVWFHISLASGKWTTNNLSDITGAPSMTGGITVWQTSWSAINIGGVDSSGTLYATWWLPEFGSQWRVSNMTQLIGGPTFTPGSVASFVTPWGAMNICGREANGTVTVYWWEPVGQVWQIAQISKGISGATATVGPVTGITAPSGVYSMSILSTSAGGEVIRLWWSPTTNQWAEQNLTQLAVPA